MKHQLKKVMAIVGNRLSEYGFIEKKTYQTFVRVIDNNILQSIGFGIATHEEKFVRYLNPSLGVTYKDVCQIELKLRNLEPTLPDYVGFMIGSPVGFLMPEHFYTEWRFTKEEDITEEAKRMANAIIQYGLPYLEKLSNRDQLIYELETGKRLCRTKFILPIFHYLNGNIKRALQCMDEYIKMESEATLQEIQEENEVRRLLGIEDREPTINPDLEYYLKFVGNFKQMISDEGNAI